jgi:hypothetical protein
MLGKSYTYLKGSISRASAPAYSSNPVRMLAGSAWQVLFQAATETYGVGHPIDSLSWWGVAGGNLSMSIGGAARVRYSPYGTVAFFVGGTAGLGFIQDNPGRDPVGIIEVNPGNQNYPCIVGSNATGQSNDVFQARTGAGPGAGQIGSRTAGVRGTGHADFKTVQVWPVTVAQLDSILSPVVNDGSLSHGHLYEIVSVGTSNFVNHGAATNTVGTIFVAVWDGDSSKSGTVRFLRMGQRAFVLDSSVAASGNFGAVVVGGGSHKVPVYHDGTDWRIG